MDLWTARWMDGWIYRLLQKARFNKRKHLKLKVYEMKEKRRYQKN